MLKFFYSQITKCQQKKKLKQQFKKYYLQNRESLELPLKEKSLKYACWFGRNASLINPNDKQLFTKIKSTIYQNLNQLTPEYCVIISQIFNNFEFQGDQQLIIKQVKDYVDANLKYFDDKDYKQIQNNLYKINYEKMNLKSLKKAFQKRNQIHKEISPLKKFMMDKNFTTTLNCVLSPNGNKITLTEGTKKLKIIGIQHSAEWIERSKKEIVNTDAIILELEPNNYKLKAENEQDKLVQKLTLGLQKVKTNNTYFLDKQNVNQYLKNFESNSSVVYYKGIIDQLRSLLKHLNKSNQQIFLADVTIDQEIFQIVSKYNLQQLRKSYAFLRYLFLNQQGRYLQDMSKRGCIDCEGHALLMSPINIADQNFFPLKIRQQLISKNIHIYMNSTPFNTYACFVGYDHIFNIFQFICKLHEKQGWNQNLNKNLISNRPKFNKLFKGEQQIHNELNKIALIETLYEKRIIKLPLQLQKYTSLYQKLYKTYKNLLYPFPIKCNKI